MLLKEEGLCRYWLSFLLPQLSLIPDSMPILQTGGILLSAGVVDFYLPQLCCGFKMKSPADVGSADGLAEQGTLSFLRRSNFCLNFSPF